MFARILMFLVRGYQVVLSPFLPPSCRFAPSCSDYMLVAVRRFGLRKGGWLGLCRICRCHPWGGSGCDTVPDALPPGNAPAAGRMPCRKS